MVANVLGATVNRFVIAALVMVALLGARQAGINEQFRMRYVVEHTDHSHPCCQIARGPDGSLLHWDRASAWVPWSKSAVDVVCDRGDHGAVATATAPVVAPGQWMGTIASVINPPDVAAAATVALPSCTADDIAQIDDNDGYTNADGMCYGDNTHDPHAWSDPWDNAGSAMVCGR